MSPSVLPILRPRSIGVRDQPTNLRVLARHRRRSLQSNGPHFLFGHQASNSVVVIILPKAISSDLAHIWYQPAISNSFPLICQHCPSKTCQPRPRILVAKSNRNSNSRILGYPHVYMYTSIRLFGVRFSSHCIRTIVVSGALGIRAKSAKGLVKSCVRRYGACLGATIPPYSDPVGKLGEVTRRKAGNACDAARKPGVLVVQERVNV